MKKYRLKNVISSRIWPAISALVIFTGTAAVVSAQKTDQSKQEVKPKQEDVQTIKLTARKGRGRRDRNIRPGRRAPALGETVCSIEIKNNTKYLVYVYVNDVYKGAASVGNSFKTVSNPGRIRIYSRTDRQNYNFLYWGPSYFTCGSSQRSGAVFLEINPAR